MPGLHSLELLHPYLQLVYELASAFPMMQFCFRNTGECDRLDEDVLHK